MNVLTFPKDFSASGIKLYSGRENDRNAAAQLLVKDVLQRLHGKDLQVIVAHHLCYSEQDGDQFIVEEIPSMDTLIFDHDIARSLWGNERYLDVLARLALEPVQTRDALFADYFYALPRV